MLDVFFGYMSISNIVNLLVVANFISLIIYTSAFRIAAFRDKSIDKWQRKTQVATGTAAIRNKLQAFNQVFSLDLNQQIDLLKHSEINIHLLQNISEQVSSYMRDPSRMIKQMQLRRSTVGVFGVVSCNILLNVCLCYHNSIML